MSYTHPVLSRAAVVTIVVLAAAIPAGAAKPPPSTGVDYDVSSDDWNGLSELETLAAGEGIAVEQQSHLDWNDVGPNDILFILYPTVPLEPAHISTFIRGGGRLLIADDFGQSHEALANLHILREDGVSPNAVRYQDDNTALPIATPTDDDHPLARDVPEIVTNHPSIFKTSGLVDTVFSFGRGQAVVVAGTIGDGKFVALSDPSILINAMLKFDGNAQFAVNLIKFLEPAKADLPSARLIVVTRDVMFSGEPSDAFDKARALSSVNGFARELDKYLDDLNDYIASKNTMRTLGIVGAFAVLVFGLALLPLAQDRQRLDGSWTRSAAGTERVDFERLLAHYDDHKRDASFAYPGAVLRDAIDARLAEICEKPAPLVNLSSGELLGRVERKAGAAAAHALQEALPSLLLLPSRDQAQGVWGSRHVSRREFERAYDAVMALERALEKPVV